MLLWSFLGKRNTGGLFFEILMEQPNSKLYDKTPAHPKPNRISSPDQYSEDQKLPSG